MESRLISLENRITALEEIAQGRQVVWDEICGSWEAALISLVHDFGLEMPAKLKGKESHS